MLSQKARNMHGAKSKSAAARPTFIASARGSAEGAPFRMDRGRDMVWRRFMVFLIELAISASVNTALASKAFSLGLLPNEEACHQCNLRRSIETGITRRPGQKSL
jgi:hypothetical protein